jgi:hypothetical protein
MTQTANFVELLAAEKIGLEMRLESYRYANIYGLKLEDAIERETDRLMTMKKLYAVMNAIDEWMKAPMRTMVDGDLYVQN